MKTKQNKITILQLHKIQPWGIVLLPTANQKPQGQSPCLTLVKRHLFRRRGERLPRDIPGGKARAQVPSSVPRPIISTIVSCNRLLAQIEPQRQALPTVSREREKAWASKLLFMPIGVGERHQGGGQEVSKAVIKHIQWP